ncbi:MAG: GNAT family N-acetyltransferase [Actinomycetota bacterium]
MSAADLRALNDPALFSLRGAHRRFRLGNDDVCRFHPEIAPFAAVSDRSDPASFLSLASLVEPGDSVPVVLEPGTETPGFVTTFSSSAFQMLGTAVEGRFCDEAIVLNSDDAPEMFALVSETEPGPFAPRAVELGTYLGIRREGALIAMAGQRFDVGFGKEISAVCTLPAFRGQGLAEALIRHLVALEREAGGISFLHVAETNPGAHSLYERMGFVDRAQMSLALLERLPD